MKIYLVGGAVRDILLGREIKDYDYVVVGATVKEFLEKHPGAKQIGKAFPVFLYDGCEYAMARTEHSTGKGHTDFEVNYSPTVTLEQDLQRRDLTINAMAIDTNVNELILTGSCEGDLKFKTLKHVNSITFAEDPLRVFRVARFAAELPGFTVARSTIELMRSMKGELKNLPAERVTGEMIKALNSDNPRRFFEVLKEAECLGYWFKELEDLIGVPAGPDNGKHKGEVDCFHHTMRVISKAYTNEPYLLFACLCHDLGKAVSPAPPKHHGHDKEGEILADNLSTRLKVPGKFKRAALMFTRQHIRMHCILEMRAAKAVRLIEKINRGFPGGLRGFLYCSYGDGTAFYEIAMITAAARTFLAMRLTEKYWNRGEASRQILLQLQAETWNKSIKGE